MPAVYDDETERTNTNPRHEGSHDDLGVHPEHREAEVQDMENLYSAESAPEPDSGGRAENQEQSKLNDQVGSGYTGEGVGKGIRGRVSRFRRNFMIGSGLMGLLVGLMLALFNFLLPFKLTHVLNSIENRVGSIPQYAVERRLEFYVSRYLMIRSLEKTGSFDFRPGGRDSGRFTYLGNSFWDSMYTNWRGAKLEEKLLTKYGVKLTPTGSQETFLNTNRLSARYFTLDFEGLGRKHPLQGKPLDRAEARSLIRTFARDEVKSRNVFKRFFTRRIMYKYYGIGKWKPFEKTRDRVSNKLKEKRTAFKKAIINQTVGRVSDRASIYLGCMADSNSSKSCRKQLKKPDPKTPGALSSDNGANDVNSELSKESSGSSDGKKSRSKKLTEIIQKHSVKKLLSAAAGIGIIDLLANMYTSLDSGVLNQVIYDKNAQQYVAFAAPLLSAADQVKAGGFGGTDFDYEDVQVAHEILGNFAESPVYRAGGGAGGSVSAQSTGAIWRDCNNDDSDGNETRLEPGETVCPNKRLMVNKTEFTEHAAWDTLRPVVDGYNASVGKIVGAVNSFVSGILDTLKINDAISWAMDELGIASLAESAFSTLLNWVAGPVLTGAEEDGDAYDAMFAAVSVLQSEAGGGAGANKEDTIGGGPLSTEQAHQIATIQQEEYAKELANKSFFDRYISPNTPESLLGRLAVIMPSPYSQSGQLFMSLLKSPLAFARLATTIVTGSGRVSAQQDATSFNPFKVIQFGYPDDHEVFTANNGEGMDPDEINQKFACNLPVDERPQNNRFGWVEGIEFEVPLEADPCLLEEATNEIGTRYFTGEVGASSFSDSQTSTPTDSLPTEVNPGGMIIGDPYTDTTNVPCAPGTRDIGFQDAYVDGQMFRSRMCSLSNLPSSGQADNAGRSYSTPGADGHAIVNSRVSGAWYQLIEDAKKAGVNLSALSSFRSMPHQQYLWNENPDTSRVARPGYSSHQAGVAIDFNNMSGYKPGATCSNRASNAGAGYQWLRENAHKYGFKQYAAEAWHWDALPINNRC